MQGGSPRDADVIALELADLADRLGCGWCLLWAKHDSLVAAAKRAAPELDVRRRRPSCTISQDSILDEKLAVRVLRCLPTIGRCLRAVGACARRDLDLPGSDRV